eukprot:10367-Pelagococcus_subviridis.AAC.6
MRVRVVLRVVRVRLADEIIPTVRLRLPRPRALADDPAQLVHHAVVHVRGPPRVPAPASPRPPPLVLIPRRRAVAVAAVPPIRGAEKVNVAPLPQPAAQPSPGAGDAAESRSISAARRATKGVRVPRRAAAVRVVAAVAGVVALVVRHRADVPSLVLQRRRQPRLRPRQRPLPSVRRRRRRRLRLEPTLDDVPGQLDAPAR